MTKLVARLVLAMMILPFTGTLVILAMAGFASRGRGGPPPATELLGMWAVVYGFVAVYWILVWRDVVRWTARRKALTLVAGLAALGIGTLVGVFLYSFLQAPASIAVLISGGTIPVTWVFATVLIWRETPQERLQRLSAVGVDTLACPICGYNLTGLRESRCPECGAGFTLDQLVASQARADEVLKDLTDAAEDQRRAQAR